MGRRVTSKSGLLLEVLLLLTILLMAWSMFLFGDSVLYSGDTFYYFYPLRHTLFEALAQGALPWWETDALSGNPFCANPQANCFYPLSLWFFLPDFFQAYHGSVVSHLAIGGLGTWGWLRARGYRGVSTLVPALVMMGGGVTLSMINRLDKLESFIWWPLAFWGLELARSRRPVGWVMLGLGMILGALAGGLEVWALGVGAIFAWCLFSPARIPHGIQGTCHLDDPREDTVSTDVCTVNVTPLTRSEWLARVGLVLLISLALSATQWFALAELLEWSTRSSGMSFEQATELSLQPRELLGVVFPHIFYDPAAFQFRFQPELAPTARYLYGLYIGWLPLVSLGVGLLSLGKRGGLGAEARIAAGLVVVGLLMAFGRHNPLYHALFEWIAPLRSIRYPAKFICLSLFFSLPLMAAGLERLGQTSRGWVLVLCMGLAMWLSGVVGNVGSHRLVSSLCAWLLGGDDAAWRLGGAAVFEDWQVQGLLLSGVGVLGVLSHRQLLEKSKGALLICAIVGLDLWMGGWALNPPMSRPFMADTPVLARIARTLDKQPRLHILPLYSQENLQIPAAFSHRDSYRWLRAMLYPNTGQLNGIAYADGSRALRLEHTTRYFAPLKGAALDVQLRILRPAAVNLMVVLEQQVRSGVVVRPEFEPLAREARFGHGLLRIRDSLPAAYLASNSVRFPDSSAIRQAILQGTFTPGATVALIGAGQVDIGSLDGRGQRPDVALDGMDPRADAIGNLEKRLVARADVEAGLHEARLTWSPGGDEFETVIDSARGGYLVVTQSWYPGWRAFLDGDESDVVMANGYQLAVAIPSGRHTIRMHLELPHVRLAMGLGLCGILVSLGWAWRSGYR